MQSSENIKIVIFKARALIFETRVVDPNSFFTDPDPDQEFDVGDQYGSGSKSGSGSGSKSNTDPGLKWPKIEKKLQLKIFFLSFLIKNCN